MSNKKYDPKKKQVKICTAALELLSLIPKKIITQHATSNHYIRKLDPKKNDPKKKDPKRNVYCT